ncbi:MAG: hexokinase [Kiritimatiellae bacterium]|nr:hexokinase [Kiritimatiellia bacterium]
MTTPEDFLREHGFTAAAELNRQALVTEFLSEMEKGLKGEESSLMMIPTFVGVEGRAKEGAKVAVLDAGGTNFRGAIVEIPPKIDFRENRPMPGTKGEVGVEEFYKAFADEIARLRPMATVSKIGWCFSYPAEATRDLDARLVRWTKNISAPGIVGQHVGRELLARLGGGEIAIVNDTVATLLAAKATEGAKTYSSYVGFILGTGTNCAYVEKCANIGKLGSAAGEGSMIINAESGNFSKIEQSEFDMAVDAKSGNPGNSRFEKMIAGAYLGAIGLEIFKAAAKAGMFSAQAASAVGGVGQLETMDLDNFCAKFAKPGRSNPLDSVFGDPSDAQMARRLALPVFERAAALTAVHLAAFAIKTGGGADSSAPVAINADGSTYYKTKAVPFDASVRRELDELLVRSRNIHYEITPQVEDAPMVGAAIAAML